MNIRQRRAIHRIQWDYEDRVRGWTPYRRPYTQHRRRSKMKRLDELVVLLGFLAIAVWWELNTGQARQSL